MSEINQIAQSVEKDKTITVSEVYTKAGMLFITEIVYKNASGHTERSLTSNFHPYEQTPEEVKKIWIKAASKLSQDKIIEICEFWETQYSTPAAAIAHKFKVTPEQAEGARILYAMQQGLIFL